MAAPRSTPALNMLQVEAFQSETDVFGVFRKASRAPAPANAPPRRTLAIDYFRLPESPAPANPEPAIRPADYFDPSTQRFRPVHPTELLNVHCVLVEQIYQAIGMTREEFRKRFYPILEFGAAAYQLCPASMSHHHREPGGLFLHSMQVCRHAVHLGQFARFERDRTRPVSPADQKLWGVALGFAALTHDVAKPLTDFRVVHPSFFAPGRLLPRLDDGPPPEDEPALFVPYEDTVFEWLERRGYTEYQVRWLNDHYAKHQRHAQALMSHWTTALTLGWLPEKIRSTLASIDPPEGSIEADFWDIIKKADQRSTNQYFPAVSGNASAIIADTLRRLVREGRWAPSHERFPLRIGVDQRLLLLAPNDLTQLAGQIASHPQAYALSANGPLSADQLSAHLQFECLIEADRAGHVLFNSAVAGAALPSNQRVLILNERLSRELMDLAPSAPQAPAAVPASADPTMSATTPHPAAATPATHAGPSTIPIVQSSSPAPASPPPPLDLPSLVFEFLEDVQSLNPYAIHTADKNGQPRPSHKVTSEHMQIDRQLKSGIRIGRPLIQRFAKTHAYPLDTVFSTLIGCPQVISHTEPLPPAATIWLTMSLPASKAVYNQTLSKFARAVGAPGPSTLMQAPPPLSARGVVPSTAPGEQPAHHSPDFTGSLRQLRDVPVSPPSVAVPHADLQPLLFRVFDHPSVNRHFRASSMITPLYVRFDVLANVLDQARLDGVAGAAGLDPPTAAARFVDGGFPVELHPQGIVLTEKIEPYWDRYSLVDETRP